MTPKATAAGLIAEKYVTKTEPENQVWRFEQVLPHRRSSRNKNNLEFERLEGSN